MTLARRFAGFGGLRRSGLRGAGAAAFTPASLEPQLWLRADLGVTLDGSNNVSAWANQGVAGSALDMAQGTAATRPTYSTSDSNFNSHPTLGGDGSRYLETSGTPTDLDISDADDLFAFFVFRQTTAAEDYIFGTTATTTGRVDMAIDSGGLGKFELNDGALVSASTPQATVNTVQVASYHKHGAASPSNDTIHGAVDDSKGGDTAADIGDVAPGANTMDWQILTAFDGSFSGSFNGQLAEAFVRVGSGAHLTVAEENLLIAYLNSRYGLSLSGLGL